MTLSPRGPSVASPSLADPVERLFRGPLTGPRLDSLEQESMPARRPGNPAGRGAARFTNGPPAHRRRVGAARQGPSTREKFGMRLVVDLTKCQGYAQCAFLAPEVFTIQGDEALTYDPNPDGAHLTRIRRAAAACPVQAIRLDQPDGQDGPPPSATRPAGDVPAEDSGST